MPLPTKAALQASECWKLVLAAVQPCRKAGEQLGRGSGSSVEFQDRRVYAAGDDVRHLDWRAYARTGEWTVKVYREELLPRLDLMLDTSASMDVGEGKGQRALDLCVFFARVARRQGFSVRVIPVGDVPAHLDFDHLQTAGLEFDGRLPLEHALGGAREFLRPGTLRILISDFLSRHDAAALVRGLVAGTGGLMLFQVLSSEDAHPPLGRALRMEDAETGALRDVLLDARTVADYLDRLERLTEALQIESRRAAAHFQSMQASGDFDDLCRNLLARAGLIVPG